MIDRSDHISRYVTVNSENPENSLLVKYIPNNDAGHYVPMVPAQLKDLHPFPTVGVASKRRQSGSKTILLTSSPYKKDIAEKKKRRKPF